MEHLHALNSKEKKAIFSLIEEQWGCDLKVDLALLENNEGKLFLATRELSSIPLEKLRINSAGMYIAEVKDGIIRLSIEGSQLIGPLATKNIVEITREQAGRWMMGEDLEDFSEMKGFAIVKCGDDYLGSGRPTGGKLLNFVGKNRRVSASHL